MPNFNDWVNASPENRTTAAEISQLVMRSGLNAGSPTGQVFDALARWTANHTYNEGADHLSMAIRQKTWNCVSLSRLLVVTHCALKDQHPMMPVGVQEKRINTRKLSAPMARANILSLLPNVRRPDTPAERRYTFSGHTYIAIGGVDYDLLMGTQGAAVANAFPVDVQERPDRALTCLLPPPPGGGGAPPPGPVAPPGGPGGRVLYWMRPTGARVGPQPEFELVRV